MASSSNSSTPEASAEARPPEKITTEPAVPARFETHQEVRIGEIVLAAAALEPHERETFLRQLTVSEPKLLEEARRRLEQAADLPDAFLAVPAAELLEATKLALTTPAASVPPLAAGAERYELGECLGKGGMARVYKAFDRQLHRPVALKLLERADPTTLRRFLREAQAQARVRHEYVLEVYETGDLGGQPYIAMHYVDGPTLMEIRERTSLEQKVRLMAQVAEGLHAAHREGLIHRDVKPGNVLVEETRDGKLRPWVADFGIATELGGGSSMWSAALAGTPCYIAPERLLDEHTVDRRSDIYSLGVTLYQFLSGELPFDEPNLGEMLRLVREADPPSLRERVETLPAEVEAIVMKCLAKDPEKRYSSARAVAEDLWRYLDGKPVEAHTAMFSYRLARSMARKRVTLAAVRIAAALAVVLLVSFAWSASNRARRVADEAGTARDGLAAEPHPRGRHGAAEAL